MAEQLTLKPDKPEVTSEQERVLAILAELLAEIALNISQAEADND